MGKRKRWSTIETLCNKHNVEHEHTSDGMLYLDAPEDHIFTSTGGTVIAISYANKLGQSWKPEAYAEAYRLLKDGVEHNPDNYNVRQRAE